MNTAATKRLKTAVAVALVAASAGLAGEAGATTIQSTYRAEWCRFGSFSTCAATGECLTPSGLTDQGWTLDAQKLQPKGQSTVGYPLEFICPLVRVFKNGATNSNPPPLSVQVAVQAIKNRNMTCTLYSLKNNGDTAASASFSVTTSSDVQQVVKTLQVTTTAADGSFSLACKLPNGAPQNFSGTVLYQYRSEEKSTSTDTKWRTYPSTRCVPEGAGKATKLRYFYNKAQNVDTATRNVTCPAQDVEGVAGTTPAYTATVYLNEAKSAGGSKCRLVGRWHFDSTIKESTPWISTSSSGNKTLPLAILASQNSDYTHRYSVDCQLTAGSSIYSYVMGHN